MKTHKEINKEIAGIAGDAEVYELINVPYRDGSGECCGISSARVATNSLYSTDISLAIDVAKRIADKNNYTFVLTYLPETGQWKASFGDWKNCAEYDGFNPAYCICMSILEFMGKV